MSKPNEQPQENLWHSMVILSDSGQGVVANPKRRTAAASPKDAKPTSRAVISIPIVPEPATPPVPLPQPSSSDEPIPAADAQSIDQFWSVRPDEAEGASTVETPRASGVDDLYAVDGEYARDGAEAAVTSESGQLKSNGRSAGSGSERPDAGAERQLAAERAAAAQLAAAEKAAAERAAAEKASKEKAAAEKAAIEKAAAERAAAERAAAERMAAERAAREKAAAERAAAERAAAERATAERAAAVVGAVAARTMSQRPHAAASQAAAPVAQTDADLDEEEDRSSASAGSNYPYGKPFSEQRRRRRIWRPWLATVAVIAVLIGAAAFSLPKVVDLMVAKDQKQALTHRVQRSNLTIAVTEDGNVESASNIEVKCQVAGGATILWIIPDGTEVEAGQEIVKLDQSALDDQLNTQKIAYEKALAAKIQAQEDFEAAKIGVKEYVEGTYIKELQLVESNVKIALENLRSAENLVQHTARMYRKGFVTGLQLEADQFGVERAKLDLAAAETAKKVLEDFTRAKMLKDLEALRDAAEARQRSEQAALDLEKARLDRLEAQLQNCVITAPQRGMVVYANESGRRSSDSSVQIQEGAMVRERQTIIRLPDLSNMQVRVTVHETKVEQMKPGLPARIVIQDRELKGKVISVANQPEPIGWFSPNVKEYATFVKIEGEPTGLRPGMTAQVEVFIAEHHDVLALPVQAIVEQHGRFYCWVDKPAGPERRPLVLGASNDKVIEIKDGVEEGELVLLNPRAVVAEAREERTPSATDEVTTGQPGAASGEAGNGPAEAKPAEGSEASAPPAEAKPADPFAQDAEKTPAPGADSANGPPASPPTARPNFNQMQYDKDGDRKVSREEAPERMQQFFDRMDTNGDGYLDAQEIAGMRKRMEAARQGGPPM